jgi:hypothetical protein
MINVQKKKNETEIVKEKRIRTGKEREVKIEQKVRV